MGAAAELFRALPQVAGELAGVEQAALVALQMVHLELQILAAVEAVAAILPIRY